MFQTSHPDTPILEAMPLAMFQAHYSCHFQCLMRRVVFQCSILLTVKQEKHLAEINVH